MSLEFRNRNRRSTSTLEIQDTSTSEVKVGRTGVESRNRSGPQHFIFLCSTCGHVRINMYPTDRSLSAPSHFSLPSFVASRRPASWPPPASSVPSSATNIAEVLTALGNDELAAEVGSWPAELQSKVVAAVAALSSTSTPTSASTAVRRRKSNKLDAASSSTAASWLAPAVAPADLTAELAAIQEGDRSPAATAVADEEVINFGAAARLEGQPRLAGTGTGTGTGTGPPGHRADRATGPLGLGCPSNREQVIQGVHVHLGDKGVTVQPTRRRVLKLQAMIREVLDTGVLDPPAAQRLSGKLGFLTQAVFGAVGRAAIQPIHKRAAQPARTDANLTPKLVDALLASAALLDHIQPRSTQATIFADTFFVDQGCHIKAGHVPDNAGRHWNQRRRNGWGYVVQINDQVFYDFGEAPSWFLDVFAERKAFIYALEILAQILAIATFAARLPPLWTAYIDNVAGQCALTKGYGNNGAVNGMVATMWGLAAAQAWAPHFERVPSADNISDALSRGDEREAKRRAWTRVHTRQDEILQILYQAGASTQYATASAPAELFNIAF